MWTMKSKSVYAQLFFHCCIGEPIFAIGTCKMPNYFFDCFEHCKSIYKKAEVEMQVMNNAKCIRDSLLKSLPQAIYNSQRAESRSLPTIKVQMFY